MGLTRTDFYLADEQLEEINKYLEERHQAANADPDDRIDMPSVNVCFSYTAGVGRSLKVVYDSQTEGKYIESWWGEGL